MPFDFSFGLPPGTLLLLLAGVFLVAVLYSSVGHAGASGYIAVMSLLSFAPLVIKPSALALNVLVASIATWQFYRAGHFNWRLFWPFAVLAVPLAFVGGYIVLPTQGFKILMGVVLVYSALRLVLPASAEKPSVSPAIPVALGVGAGIGLLSGLTGTGGGIFLTPLLLFLGWAKAKQAAAVSAAFILLNSVAGLLGNLSNSGKLPDFLLPLLLVAGAGGYLGSRMGSNRFPAALIKKFLALVLLVAGVKFLLT